MDLHHRDGEAGVVLRLVTELVREVAGGAETLGFAATEPIVPGH